MFLSLWGGSWKRKRRERERCRPGWADQPRRRLSNCPPAGTQPGHWNPPFRAYWAHDPSLGLSSPISSSYLKPLPAIHTIAGISPRKPEWTTLKSCPGTWIRIGGGRDQLGIPGCYHMDQASHIHPAHFCFHCSLCHCPLFVLEKYIYISA